ncbi:prostate stem cell antigen-like [Sebastes umbrosus]|uniref:prostate stem cell antigen-like n=1 Tax=Sebastes umbrosus TaxID=72105 RepID=UPI00189D2BA2|nr:prostate stem cell antigen-like [Sebastes umbrosus]
MPDLKMMLLSLAVLSLLVTPGLSLSCYVCSSAATNEECNNNNTTQECQPLLDRCMTIVNILGSTKVIVKLCASRATCNGAAATASVDENGNGNIVNCCNTHNLCNFGGAESIHVHTALLLLTGGVMLLLLR